MRDRICQHIWSGITLLTTRFTYWVLPSRRPIRFIQQSQVWDYAHLDLLAVMKNQKEYGKSRSNECGPMDICFLRLMALMLCRRDWAIRYEILTLWVDCVGWMLQEEGQHDAHDAQNLFVELVRWWRLEMIYVKSCAFRNKLLRHRSRCLL